MSGEYRDREEYQAHVELEVKKRLEQVWDIFQDPRLKEEIASLSQAEKDEINEVVKDFVIDQKMCAFARAQDGMSGTNLVAFRSVKPNGTPPDRGTVEHYAYRMVGPPDATKETYERTDLNLFNRLDTQFDPVIGLPDSKDEIFVQILPLQESNGVLVRCKATTNGSIHDDRPTGWNFNIYTGKGSSLVRFLRSVKDVRLLPFIIRNTCSILNPDSAIYVDAPVRDSQEWNVVDFGELARTRYAPKGSRLGAGSVQQFSDAPDFVREVRMSRLGTDIKSDMRGEYVPFFSGAQDANRKYKYPYPDHLKID